MIFVKKQQMNFARVGLTISGFSFALSFFAFIASLRWFGYGIWPQSESVIVVIHLLTGLSTLGLVLACHNRKILGMAMGNVMCVLPLAIGLWSLFCMIFSEIPMRSFLGSVRIGEGVVWWLNIATLSMTITILWRFKIWKIIISTAAIIGFMACYTMSVSHYYLGHYYAPLFFPDYLTFAALCLMPFLFGYVKNFRHFIVIYVLFFLVIFLTDNRTMIGFAAVLPIIIYLWMHIPLLSQKTRQNLVFTGIVILPLAFLIIFACITHLYRDVGIYPIYAMGEAIKSFASRAFLTDFSYQDLLADPKSFIVGTGWGSFVDHMAAYQPSNWINFTEYARQWDGMHRDHFHSHNMFVETLNAIGVVGFILLIIYFACFAIFAKTRYKIGGMIAASGMMFYASFWFLMPVLLPFLAFASASTKTKIFFPKIVKSNSGRYIFTFMMIIIALMQLAAAYFIYSTAQQTNKYEPAPLEITNADTVSCDMEYDDYNAGGIHLNKMLLDRVRYTIDITQTSPNDKPDKEGPEKIPAHILAINNLFCQTQRYLNENPSHVRLQLSNIAVRGEMLLALSDYLSPQAKRYYYNGWRESLLNWIEIYPNRLDMTSTYLLFNLMNGREDQSRPVINAIRNQDPEHPLYLWFHGLSLLSAPQTTLGGLNMMRQAIANGIDRFIVVDEDTRATLEQLD